LRQEMYRRSVGMRLPKSSDSEALVSARLSVEDGTSLGDKCRCISTGDTRPTLPLSGHIKQSNAAM